MRFFVGLPAMHWLLATRQRVSRVKDAQLVCFLVRLQLVCYIFLYRFCVLPFRTAFLIFPVLPAYVLRKILFCDILVQTLCDTCNSIAYVLNYLRY